MVKNSAFVFIKPHAVTDKVKDLVKEVFEKNGISITKEGSLEAGEIDQKKLIDNHYYAIASKATILTPDKLAVPKDKFEAKFGLKWDDVLKDGKALNAMDCCAKFEIDAMELDAMWAKCKKAGDLVKFGGGFYCGKLEKEGKGTYYVFNGFFMSMRSKFVEEGASIYYYVVEWDSKLEWKDFRGDVLGPTDPATASKDSLRGAILARWQELGLQSEPNTGDNGVHASASPFEALSERVNWLGSRIEQDSFGQVLLKAGLSPATINEWCRDPQVTFGPIEMTRSLFDSLEDTDSDWCAALCQMINLPNKKAPEKEPKQEAKKEKAGKKDEKKKAEKADEAEKEPTPEELEKMKKDKLKKVIKEGGKRGVEIEGAADMGGLQFFCTSVDLPDGDLDLLVESMKAMNEKSDPTEEERKGGSGHIGKTIFSAGLSQLAVVSYVPKEKQGEISCEEWLQSILANFQGEIVVKGEEVCAGFVKANSDKNVFPLKIREPMILEANNFLRKKGLFPEDDSDDDEMVFGDDDFPSM